MKKPSIIILSDFPDWAFGFITRFVDQQLSYKYDIYFDYMIFHDYVRGEDKVLPPLNFKLFLNDPIVFFKRVVKKIRNLRVDSRRFKWLSNNYDIIIYLDYYVDLKGNFPYNGRKIIRGIFTDGFPPYGLVYDYKRKINPRSLKINEFVDIYLQDADALVVGSETNIITYQEYFKPVFFANMCYNLNQFNPNRFNRIEKSKDNFVIAWTGNPNAPFKNYKSFILPLIHELKIEIPSLVFKTRFGGPFNTLPEFYIDVDLVVIASESDAGPSMFMEAALMKVPAVSTNVGFPSFVIKNWENGVLVELDIDSFKKAILRIYENNQLLQNMKMKIREDFINVMGPEIMKKQWEKLISYVLKK